MATLHLNDGTYIQVKETANEIDEIIRNTKNRSKDEIFIRVTYVKKNHAENICRIQIKRIIEYYD